jgi:hypothetical protein
MFSNNNTQSLFEQTLRCLNKSSHVQQSTVTSSSSSRQKKTSPANPYPLILYFPPLILSLHSNPSIAVVLFWFVLLRVAFREKKKTIAEEPQGSSVFAAGSIELDEFTVKLNAELSELEFESGFQRGPVHCKLGSEDDVVTVSDWPVSIVGSLVPAGRRHELRCESGDVTQWKRRGSGGFVVVWFSLYLLHPSNSNPSLVLRIGTDLSQDLFVDIELRSEIACCWVRWRNESVTVDCGGGAVAMVEMWWWEMVYGGLWWLVEVEDEESGEYSLLGWLKVEEGVS